MEGYRPETYGEKMANTYDAFARMRLGELPVAVVDRLAQLAGGGRALELGIGTGRVALPLAARGVEVAGLDVSAPMVAKMQEKPGGDRIQVTMGDMVDVGVDGSFNLVFVVFNTFFALLTQEEQITCFRNVAARLERGGCFLIEAFFPDVSRYDRNQRVDALDVSIDGVVISVAMHDRAAQRIDAANLTLGEDGIGVMPVALRYAWPSELDLMAQLAGLALESRWGDWSGAPFTSSSDRHISVYRKP
jgi:cyclopropane fatty-acyl-phospholipid synthase-like methyltransferase